MNLANKMSNGTKFLLITGILIVFPIKIIQITWLCLYEHPLLEMCFAIRPKIAKDDTPDKYGYLVLIIFYLQLLVVTNYIVAALHPKDVSQGCFIFIWYFLQHIIRRIQYDYFIPYCIFSYNLIVRPFFPWPACNTHNSISGHTHYYFFSLYSVLHLITFVERSALLYLGAGIQFLYGIYALSKTLFGGYHNLRQMILAVGWTNIFYVQTIFIINVL